ncbi:MAG TPA: galactokinase family protein [bacterium]|nr:galactokinase family protein [bacterium]HQO35395.1 galactokinase family protein [bacterium]HQQ00470.1 galactokinase family protein [bacterium]
MLTRLSCLTSRIQSGDSWPALHRHYGEDGSLLKSRLELLKRSVSSALERWGDRKVFLVRVPARVNLMGVHVDHRGGFLNYQTVARETLLVASPREDDRITACNVNPNYPETEFSIGELLPLESRGNWMRFIEGFRLEKGHWSNYLKAAVLKIQDRFPERTIHGFDLCVYGDIPPGAGLSSSSSLVVGTMMIANRINGLRLSNEEMVPLCAEGEWFVGTRGGAGDQGAMLLCKRGLVTHLRFFPMEYRYAPLPNGYSVVVCHSRIEAQKSAGARETFNWRVSGYALSLLWVKDKFPEYADRLEHLRDIHPLTLRVDEGTIYEILRTVPVEITAEELLRDLPSRSDEVEKVFSTFGRSSQPYPLREILLFGLAECRRAEVFADLLDRGDVSTAGRLMYISHDGDRVSRTRDGASEPYRSPHDDEFLEARIQDCRSADPDRMEQAALQYQPGGYRCSVPDLDRMVDVCSRVEGVAGAGLTGAGLGGCILVLVRDEAVENLCKTLDREYYRPLGREPFMEVCVSVAGADFIGES